MSYTLTFQDYIKNELEEQDIKNKEYEYDDYSMIIEVDYTTQE
jgi:hypothetical protein